MSTKGGTTGLSRAQIGTIKKGEGKAIMTADQLIKLAGKYGFEEATKKAKAKK